MNWNAFWTVIAIGVLACIGGAVISACITFLTNLGWPPLAVLGAVFGILLLAVALFAGAAS